MATSGSAAILLNFSIIHELALRGKVFCVCERGERLYLDGQDNSEGKGNGDSQDVRI